MPERGRARFDKLALNFLAMAKLASVRLLLRRLRSGRQIGASPNTVDLRKFCLRACFRSEAWSGTSDPMMERARVQMMVLAVGGSR